ncbi:NH3-dependent NAD+ synthetase [Giardia duodenalis]|uniref:NH3-dependent NAD+ synthetase n=1 Tax=Giardia intestinalis (strain ATCC 50803 / WB clone C6) TaxID=184922 RepID=A8BSZ5_GIAIC|nr:NH3-dependent NAD+ synthetase [Giardia intestinalis]KAE8305935.1 NH3-dependent NAD+ synthetase [Giardia intestinalis]|eukprot:XP_001704996.1 NH3-dependent NAD+ synthetase [Giardia lamblia ATCC 50803]
MAEEMHPELRELLAGVRKKRAFSPSVWVAKKVDALNEYARKTGIAGCIVNLSGGIDSAVTFALLARSKAAEKSPITRVLGLAQPILSTASIQNRAYELSSYGEIVTVDQTDIFMSLTSLVEDACGIRGKEFARGNLKSYMRTPAAFYVAQLLSQEGTPSVVVGTGNYDEDGFLYYFSKAGDGVSDIQLIHDLHKSEVFAVGRYLGLPESILDAPPSADLWEGQTDEEEIGASYDFVELYVSLEKDAELKKTLETVSRDAQLQYEKVGRLLESIHVKNGHKKVFPLNI